MHLQGLGLSTPVERGDAVSQRLSHNEQPRSDVQPRHARNARIVRLVAPERRAAATNLLRQPLGRQVVLLSEGSESFLGGSLSHHGQEL